MLRLSLRFMILSCLILMFGVVFLAACQTSDRQIQCCQLEYGLLRPNDLSGKWNLTDESQLITVPSVARYKQVTPTESVRQYVIGNSSRQKEQVTIIHDIRLYNQSAPSFGPLDYKPGVSITIPGLLLDEYASQIQCLAQDPSDAASLSFCVVETAYDHLLSTMYFYFDTSASTVDIATYINQAFAKTDVRVKEIGQHLDEAGK
jgi:hypothetical protein